MGQSQTRFDFAVIGAGIAGSAIAAHLAEHGSVCLLEMESQPGVHSTGRSAAIYVDFYGNATIRALTRASHDFLAAPPPGFGDGSLLRERPILVVARDDQRASFDALLAATGAESRLAPVSTTRAVELCPVLDERRFAAAAVATAADIDVHALHHGYLRWLRERGGVFRKSARVDALSPHDGGWRLGVGAEEIRARTVVNAAGAWAAEIGALAGARDLGLASLRRSAALIEPPAGESPASWAAVIDVDEQFYLKPEAGLLMISPADETPAAPGGVQPDDLDIAIAVERVQALTRLEVRRVRHRWAGLRTFVADRSPVTGFDPDVPDFFWHAALGGYGIQTAPALASLAARLALGDAAPQALAAHGLDAHALAPGRAGIGPANLLDRSRPQETSE